MTIRAVTRQQIGLWVRREIVDRVLFHGRPVVCALAFVWRRMLVRTTFVAITGSLGKTTAKECLAACLGARFRTLCGSGDSNADGWLALDVLRVRPWHRYAVFEVAAGQPGHIARRARMIRPDVAIVLGVARTHTSAYPTLDACAAEKARLLAALRPGGLAVLNVDDPRVAAMHPPEGCHVIRVGAGPSADVRGEVLATRWPERFSLQVKGDGEAATIRTCLVGDHWLPAVLAAVAVARRAGVTFADAGAALERRPPVTGRLEPVQLASGAVVLRDDYNAAVDTLDAALRILDGATAARRILLVSDFSDSGANRKRRLQYLARAAARSADAVIFVGENAAYGGRRAVEAGVPAERVHHFDTLEEAARFLRADLNAGDLLLLKGRTTDHVTRVFHALSGPIACWKTRCERRLPCDKCWELGARRTGGLP